MHEGYKNPRSEFSNLQRFIMSINLQKLVEDIIFLDNNFFLSKL